MGLGRLVQIRQRFRHTAHHIHGFSWRVLARGGCHGLGNWVCCRSPLSAFNSLPPMTDPNDTLHHRGRGQSKQTRTYFLAGLSTEFFPTNPADAASSTLSLS